MTDSEAKETAKQESQDSKEQPEPPIPGMFAHWPVYLTIVVVGIVVDQLSKLWSVRVLAPPPEGEGRVIVLIPEWFQLRYATNPGAAFSILEDKIVFLISVSIAAAVLFTWWFTRLPKEEKWGRASFALVVSGAIGNLIDRVRLNYVVDMFDAFLFGWDYPVFNVADSLIVVGVCVLIVRMLQGKV